MASIVVVIYSYAAEPILFFLRNFS